MVLQKDLRPEIPSDTPDKFANLMKRCWDRNPNVRPSFKQILNELEGMKFKRKKSTCSFWVDRLLFSLMQLSWEILYCTYYAHFGCSRGFHVFDAS